jgi:hypothetical protein
MSRVPADKRFRVVVSNANGVKMHGLFGKEWMKASHSNQFHFTGFPRKEKKNVAPAVVRIPARPIYFSCSNAHFSKVSKKTRQFKGLSSFFLDF